MGLTPAERFVLDALVAGKSVSELIVLLAVSRSAIDKRLTRVRSKLGALTTYEAVAMYAVSVTGGAISKLYETRPPDPPRPPSLRELAKLHGVCRKTIQRWKAKGILASHGA